VEGRHGRREDEGGALQRPSDSSVVEEGLVGQRLCSAAPRVSQWCETKEKPEGGEEDGYVLPGARCELH